MVANTNVEYVESRDISLRSKVNLGEWNKKTEELHIPRWGGVDERRTRTTLAVDCKQLRATFTALRRGFMRDIPSSTSASLDEPRECYDDER